MAAPKVRRILKRLLQDPEFQELSAKAQSDEIRWGSGITRGSFSPIFNDIAPRSFISVFSDGSVQISYGYLPDDLEVRKQLRSCLQNHIEVPGVTDVSDGSLKSSYKAIPVEYVEEHIDQVLSGLIDFVNK